ncbi:MAG: hypothetical protein ACOH19_16415 [Rhodoglobus sp.]
MDDGASLDELKRRAYSSDDADALDARRHLVVREREFEEDAAASAIPQLKLPRVPAFPGLLAAALVLLIVTAIAVGSVAILSPKSSLDVFSRPQNSRDLEIPGLDADAALDSARWIGSFGGFDMFAYLRGADEVCVVAVESRGAHMDCTSRREFALDGIEIKAGRFTSTGTEYYTLEWGPYGAPRYEGHSVDL